MNHRPALFWQPACASCRASKEFLGERGVEFDSVNIREPDGNDRWVAAGKPIVPSLLVDGVASPILHVSQLASMLGLEAPAQLEVSRLAWDAVAVLEAWLKLIRPLDFELLIESTPSRGRSLRNLTVNVFHPIELLPAAFDDGWFDWDPNRDDEREAPLRNADAVVAYATDRWLAWRDWLLTREDDLLARDPEVGSPRGTVTYANLLASQRWHAAFHYRQLLAFLESRGHDVAGALSLNSFDDLDLPREVF
jgi:glutaredoxin